MRKKRKKEVVHVEVERQLPVKHQHFPDLDELNRVVQNIIAEERRQARRTFVMIAGLLAAFFIMLLAGMGWFARDLMQQLKAERRLSEKSREDMLALIYSGHAPAAPQPPPPTTPADMPEPEPAPPEPESAAVTGPADNSAAEDALAPTPTPPPPTPPPVFRKSVAVQVADDLIMRLPIPNP